MKREEEAESDKNEVIEEMKLEVGDEWIDYLPTL